MAYRTPSLIQIRCTAVLCLISVNLIWKRERKNRKCRFVLGWSNSSTKARLKWWRVHRRLTTQSHLLYRRARGQPISGIYENSPKIVVRYSKKMICQAHCQSSCFVVVRIRFMCFTSFLGNRLSEDVTVDYFLGSFTLANGVGFFSTQDTFYVLNWPKDFLL